jgi:hypothetical protein
MRGAALFLLALAAVEGATLDAALAEAAARGADVLVRPVFRRLDRVFRGRNARFIPNVLLWIQFWVPSFWVADEDFALEGDLELRFHSVASERLLYASVARIDALYPLDDFERGWSVTGIVTVPSTLDPDDWAKVARSLAPLLRVEAAKAAVLEVGGRLPRYLAGPDFAAKDATVFALCCGISRHAGGNAGAGSSSSTRRSTGAGPARARSFAGRAARRRRSSPRRRSRRSRGRAAGSGSRCSSRARRGREPATSRASGAGS